MSNIIDKYIYCPNCKSRLVKKGSNVSCSECNYYRYFNPVPCNGLILENIKGEIMLVKRAKEPFKGYLDLTGGFVDIAEGAEESMLRELKEETGIILSIKDIKLFMTTWDKYLYKGMYEYTLGIIYTAKLKVDVDYKANDDVSEVLFFNKNNIPWDRIAFKSVIRILKKYLRV